MYNLTCKSIVGLNICTGIPYLLMVFHILLLVNQSQAFSKSRETIEMSSLILHGEWLSESKHVFYFIRLDNILKLENITSLSAEKQIV